jgi:hypothetical protein
MKKTYVGISIHFFVVDGTKLFSQPYMESLKVWTSAKAEPVIIEFQREDAKKMRAT